MRDNRRTTVFDVDGGVITALAAGPERTTGRPLIAALHGGTYTSHYFDVDGSGHGSLLDVAAAAGYPVLSFDRPGYGGSLVLPPAENTFDRHATLLADVIGQAARRAGAEQVFLVGHSIGGMIALMIAAGNVDFRLVGASVTGMGAVIRAGGAAHALASLPPDDTVDLPYEQRDQVMFGPEHTRTEAGIAGAHEAYAPVPVRELIQAPEWPEEHLPGLASRVRVPVHNALAEFDALWDSTPGPCRAVRQDADRCALRRRVDRPLDRAQHRPSRPGSRPALAPARLRRGMRAVGALRWLIGPPRPRW